jgi:hypothetical protein
MALRNSSRRTCRIAPRSTPTPRLVAGVHHRRVADLPTTEPVPCRAAMYRSQVQVSVAKRILDPHPCIGQPHLENACIAARFSDLRKGLVDRVRHSACIGDARQHVVGRS